MTNHREMIEEAAEFGDRFPDASDSDIVEHIRFVFKDPKLPRNSVLSRACIAAAVGGVIAGQAHLDMFVGKKAS
jgi:membrane-bound lytic murein transglycosylase